MALYWVERNFGHRSFEQLGHHQEELLAACAQIRREGKKIRYISSILLPTERRGLDVFGSNEPDLVSAVNDLAHMPCTRILPIFDMPLGPIEYRMPYSEPMRRHAVRAGRVGELATGTNDPAGLEVRVHSLAKVNRQLQEHADQLQQQLDRVTAEGALLLNAIRALTARLNDATARLTKPLSEPDTPQ